MSWSCVGKIRGAYQFAMAWILTWLGGKVLVVEEGLELDGDELDDGENGWWIIGLGEWTVVDNIGEVMVKECVFIVSEDCAEILEAIAMRAKEHLSL